MKCIQQPDYVHQFGHMELQARTVMRQNKVDIFWEQYVFTYLIEESIISCTVFYSHDVFILNSNTARRPR